MDNSRIIHAPMNGRRFAVTSPITQYDYGYLLLPEGTELPTTYEVDFSNDEHKGTSLTVYGGSDGAEVPEELIRTGKDVFAFYYKIGEGYGKTDFTWRIPNHCRPSRDGETPTPSQQSSIDQLIVRSNEAVEQAEQSASDASTSAQNASADAERAEEARTDAQNYATQAEQARDDAQTYANNASASATASAQSASQSAQIKADVEDLVDDAQASANASAQSATASANSASQASGYAQSASASAQSASGYASQAQTSAQTASSKATEASGYASTASAKATESAQSATNASQSAQTAEQAKTDAETAQASAEQAKTDAISAKESAEDARDEAQNLVDGISGKVEQIDSNTERIESLEDDRYKPYAVDTASGAIASFSDGADDIPLKSLVVNIDPVQDLHGYDSPWVAGGGKNKIPFPYITTSGTIDGITYTIGDDGKITATGTTERGTNFYFARNIVLTAGTYTASVIGDFIGMNFMFYDSVNRVTVCNILPAEYKHWKTFTIENDTSINIYLNNGNKNVDVNISAYFQLEQGSTATSYAPYENICPISGWTGCNVQCDGTNLWGGSISDSPNGKRVSSYGATGGYPRLNKRINPNTYTISVICNLPSGVAQETWAKSYYIRAWFKSAIDGKWYDIASVSTGELRPSTSSGSILFEWTAETNISATPTKIVSKPFKLTIPVSWIALGFYKSGNYVEYTSIQLEVGNTVSDIEAYKWNSIPISWQTEAGTVYGGKLDVLSGVLRVTKYAQDMNALTWRTRYTGTTHKALSTTLDYRYARADAMKIIAEKYPLNGTVTGIATLSNPDNYNVGLFAYSNTNSVIANSLYCVIDVDGEMPSGLVVYDITAPIEIQLTHTEVRSLLGQNNIFADTGDTEVEYRADTKLYISRLTEPDADMIADANIVSGQYFMVGNNLFKATANIASGASVIVGTNAIRKSLSEALNEINA